MKRNKTTNTDIQLNRTDRVVEDLLLVADLESALPEHDAQVVLT